MNQSTKLGHCPISIASKCPEIHPFLLLYFCVAYSISSVAETRDMALSFASRDVEFMRWLPVASITNGVLKVTHRGI